MDIPYLALYLLFLVIGFALGPRERLRSPGESSMNTKYLIALLLVMELMVYMITALISPRISHDFECCHVGNGRC